MKIRCVIEPGCERRSLTEVPAQLDQQHTRIHRRNLFQQAIRTVSRAIVDHQDFDVGIAGGCVKVSAHVGQGRGKSLLLVVRWNNDG